MVYVNKGLEKVTLEDVNDSKELQMALIENDCLDKVSVQHIIGKDDVNATFIVAFGTHEIKCITQGDAELVTRWLLTLEVDDVLIRRAES